MKLHLSRSRLSVLCGALGVIALAGVRGEPAAASSPAPAAVTVSMTDARFMPATLHVRRGGNVTWRNESQLVHTVTADGFDSGSVAPGAIYMHTFDRPGTYDYHCTPHQAAGMVGRVIVDP